MAIFKCKMCGGSLEIDEGMTVCECEYCGTQQTLPKNHDDVLTNNFKRTPDSVIANDIYHQLTNEGFKVFYAAITLEDKLGQEYEPYIFAALSSAKVMLCIGTR